MAEEPETKPGAVYIPPKPVQERKPEQWPRFVWLAHPSRLGYATCQIWYRRQTTGQWVKGKLEDKPTLSEHVMEDADKDCPFDVLARLYPPPKDYKWWRQP